MGNRKRTKSERVRETSEVLRVADEGHHAVRQLGALIAGVHPEKNPIRQNTLLKKYAHSLIELCIQMTEVHKGMREMLLMETPNSHLPWEQNEDEWIVEARSRGEEIHDIARNLGRTPAAVATRLSVLIGVPRSEIVTAYIDGVVDDKEPVRGIFHGVTKRVPN